MFASIAGIVLLLVVIGAVLTMVMLRRVVPTNMVHIVQSSKETIEYGRGQNRAGNTYYAWPSWLPKWGVIVTEFPESIFDVSLKEYEGYDQDRLPFLVDVKAFFRIADATMAAQRVANFNELYGQLTAVLQGAIRRILSTNHLENIMQDRSNLGQQFTEEVDHQLQEWGVQTVKSIEFMDIKDKHGSEVIHNIMQKEESRIEMESRVRVAENNRAAELAEIDAQRTIDVQKQDAQQQVGIRTAEKDKVVGIAREKASQEVQTEAATTAERTMATQRVNSVKQAEIDRDVAIVTAERDKKTRVINAEAEKLTAITLADGQLEATKKEAEGTRTLGEAQGAAEQAKLMAPVNAQITLAEKIGSDTGYQNYLIQIRQVEANETVGVEQAKALIGAEIKVIANGGSVQGGIGSVGDILSSKGGTNIGALVSALAANEDVQKVVSGVVDAIKK